jgi:hypothetical protein
MGFSDGVGPVPPSFAQTAAGIKSLENSFKNRQIFYVQMYGTVSRREKT